MKILFVDHGQLLNAELRGQAERRLRYALTRFEAQVTRVRLIVQDENGPKRGLDKACRVDVHLRQGEAVSVSDLDVSVLAAVSRAADRVGRAVSRRLSHVAPSERHSGMTGR